MEKQSSLEKTVKLSKEPYNNKKVAEVYEERYTHHPFVKEDTEFEIETLENLLEDKGSWCDVACGTAYHLRKAKGSFKRFGLDRSSVMINEHKEETDYEVTYFVEDLLSFEAKQKFDLVSNFWFGYSHQPTLQEVLKFFVRMADITDKGGSLVLSVHNNWRIFDKIPRLTNEPMGGVFSFDSIQWSYKEPSTGDVYECISPHKTLIEETLSPFFKKLTWKDYPQFAGKELLILEDRHGI